jgi:hypothetical protein
LNYSISELSTDKIIIKPMNFNELLIALERLIRFEYPIQKKDRVYKEILFKHLINPKINSKNYYNYSLNSINALVKEIWNYSLEKLGADKQFHSGINTYYAYEEIMTFSCETMLYDIISSENISKFVKKIYYEDITDNPEQITEIFNDAGFNLKTNTCLSSVYLQYHMSHPLNIDGLLELTTKDLQVSANLKRLKLLNQEIKEKYIDITEYNQQIFDYLYKENQLYREKSGGKFPLKLLMIVEGITEEKLLPLFAKQMGLNFDKKGIHLIAAGGKNQSAKLYKRYSKETNLPILVLLDSDAELIAKEIQKELRPIDRIFKIQSGEFEDILSVDLICRALNSYYRLTAEVSSEDFTENTSRVFLLENLWKKKGFGEFHKSEFAKIIAENISSRNDLSDELKNLLNQIAEMEMK